MIQLYETLTVRDIDSTTNMVSLGFLTASPCPRNCRLFVCPIMLVITDWVLHR